MGDCHTGAAAGELESDAYAYAARAACYKGGAVEKGMGDRERDSRMGGGGWGKVASCADGVDEM